jgi:signal transduction histidine kinase/CheY-like chemotaxis protein
LNAEGGDMNGKHDPPLILVADDQEPTTIMLERVFEYEGYQVQSVHDGIAAIKAAQSILPDLILLDVNMPGLNGFEVLERLRSASNTASIPTILITARGDLSNVIQGLNLGADDYLRKPFHPQELLARAQSKMRARKLEEDLQRRTQSLEALLRASEELNQHLEVDDLLNIILYLVADLLPGEITAVMYFDEAGNITDSRVNGPLQMEESQLINPVIVKRMLEENHSICWPESPALVSHYTSGISVPMQHGSVPRGLLMVLTNQLVYDQNHVRLLEGISRQAALALRKAELYDIQANYALHLEDMVAERTAELESTQQMLIRAEKLASAGRLAASVAHEINNPLQPIKINLECMLEDVADSNSIIKADDINLALESVDRIQTTVSRLLGFTVNRQVDNAEFNNLDINQVIESIVNLNSKFFQQDGLLIEAVLAPLPQIHGSKYQLEHVFMNLALNAKDAMRKGDVLKFTTYTQFEKVIIEVQDTGAGIAPEIIDTIFEPFVSTKESGNGLGLFISYGIIQKHNGTVQVESNLKKGTQFTLAFPVVPQ